MTPFAEVGWGEIALALVPTLNLAVLAIIWKLTGKVQGELTGQTAVMSEVVHDAKQEIRDDLKNGIRGELATVVDQVNNEVLPRLDHKRERLDTIEKKIDDVSRKVG